MQKYSFKPLLLIIPCILFLALLVGTERFYDESQPKKTVPTSNSNVFQDSKTQNIQGKSSIQGESNNSTSQVSPSENTAIYGSNPVVLYLAIGTIGSVKEGGFTWIYEDANEESEPQWRLQYNCGVVIMEDYDDDWYCVDVTGDGGVGYVKKEECRPLMIAVGSSDPVRDKIVKKAYSYLGLPFKRYGKSLKEGIDCSNFIQQIYDLYGISIPNTPLEQRAFGKQVIEEQALPGDLVFYDKANAGTGHVALYLGNGMMINSSGHSGKEYPRGGVRICCLTYKDRDSYQFYNLLVTDKQEEQQNWQNGEQKVEQEEKQDTGIKEGQGKNG